MGASRELSELGSVVVVNNGNIGIGVSPAGTSAFELKAGTTSIAPLEFNSGTNTTLAVSGTIEYDGKVFYATPQGVQRGVIPGAQFFRLDSGLAGANVNTAQNIFGVGVTLSANTVYAFEAQYALTKTAGTNSHNISSSFAGTAGINSIQYETFVITGSTFPVYDTGASGGSTNVASSSTISTNITTATVNRTFVVKGIVSINTEGTFIPQYTLSAAPGGAYTTVANSYMMIYPIGISGANTSIGTWA